MRPKRSQGLCCLVGLPFIGPVVAPTAAAGAMGAVLAVEGMVASAEGGWDVPANSFARLHAKEMVLPAHLAEGVRNMTGDGTSGASGRRGGDAHFHIQATDAESFTKQLGRSNSELNRLIRRSIRDGNLPIRR